MKLLKFLLWLSSFTIVSIIVWFAVCLFEELYSVDVHWFVNTIFVIVIMELFGLNNIG